jgi:hypothetical protein
MKIMTMMPCARISILLAMRVAVAAHAAPANANAHPTDRRY